MSHSHPQENLLQVHGIVVIVNIRIQISWKQIVYENPSGVLVLAFEIGFPALKVSFYRMWIPCFVSFQVLSS